ncbi:histidine kinase N-terminal 7TM domain-containing protein [Natrinema halophilum]|uniref:histidine kinase n=1 Tax=Natrinema halophilum TaxID=1699371 RepID=A0A7D5GFS4_9EURY|nr:histidine kinase N-terminal 7TM domain-containing protein [Natrinema halophilum]QLG47787.1 ATP-binding protein [Natrinema halophilum]
MSWQFTPVTVPLVLVTLLGSAGAFGAWYQREGPTETWGAITQLTSALWAFVMLVTVSRASPEWQLFWFLVFLSIPLMHAVSAFCFAVYFTGRGEWLTRRRLAILLFLPLSMLVFALTNWWHELIVTNPVFVTKESWAYLEYDWGAVFWLIFGIGYTLIVANEWLLLKKFLHSRNVYRKLSFTFLLVHVATVLATVPSVFQFSPLPYFLIVPYVHLALGGVQLLVATSARFANLLPIDRILTLLSSRLGSLVTLARDYVIEEVDNGLVILDDTGRIVDVNRTARKMLGWERPVGRTIEDVADIGPVEDPGVLEPIITGEEPIHELKEAIWLRTDNGRRCYDVRVSALSDADKHAGHVILLHDITEQKHREQRLEKREQELEEQKAALEQRTDQLEYQNERLDEFASIVSHDLRNPLAVAQGYLDVLEQQANELPDESPIDETTIDEIDDSHQRIEAIIDDALTLARQGKAITATETVSLPDVVTTAWDNVDTKDASLECDADGGLDADRDRLLNVFENLFRNAVEHGGRDVTVKVGTLPNRNGLYVEDDGSGIPADRIDKVLEHGYTTNDQGTGLGLSIVADIIRAHGWGITATNGADGGARFEFTDIGSLNETSRKTVSS